MEENLKIRSIACVTAQGVSMHIVGDKRTNVSSITKELRSINGDNFDFYIVKGPDGKLLAEINCLIPCEIKYF